MKKFTLLLSIAICISAMSYAQGNKNQNRFDAMDTNNDQLLSFTEYLNAKSAGNKIDPSNWQNKFNRLDKDHDGNLSKQEFGAIRSKRKRTDNRKDKKRVRNNANANQQNRPAVKRQKGYAAPKQRKATVFAQRFNQADANQDGQLNFQEFKIINNRTRKYNTAIPAKKMYQRLDTNNDGTLSIDEYKQIRNKRRSPRGRKVIRAGY